MTKNTNFFEKQLLRTSNEVDQTNKNTKKVVKNNHNFIYKIKSRLFHHDIHPATNKEKTYGFISQIIVPDARVFRKELDRAKKNKEYNEIQGLLGTIGAKKARGDAKGAELINLLCSPLVIPFMSQASPSKENDNKNKDNRRNSITPLSFSRSSSSRRSRKISQPEVEIKHSTSEKSSSKDSSLINRSLSTPVLSDQLDINITSKGASDVRGDLMIWKDLRE